MTSMIEVPVNKTGKNPEKLWLFMGRSGSSKSLSLNACSYAEAILEIRNRFGYEISEKVNLAPGSQHSIKIEHVEAEDHGTGGRYFYIRKVVWAETLPPLHAHEPPLAFPQKGGCRITVGSLNEVIFDSLSPEKLQGHQVPYRGAKAIEQTRNGAVLYVRSTRGEWLLGTMGTRDRAAKALSMGADVLDYGSPGIE